MKERAVKSILFPVAVTTVSIVPAHAVLVGLLLPFHKRSEMVVGIVSRCTKPATYNLAITNAINGEVLYRTQGRIAAGRGVALPYSFGASQTGSVLRVSAKWECPDPDPLKPLIGITVRDLTTKVPQYMVKEAGFEK